MKDRRPLLVYLPRDTREAIQRQADEEGTSASAIGRRVLVKQFPPKKKS